MFKIATSFRKAVLVVLVTITSLAVLPVTNVYALWASQDINPPQVRLQRDERLEKIFAREKVIYERQSQRLDRADQIMDKVQTLIDAANEKGYDTTAVQSALDAFEAAVKQARPVHQRGQGIIASHKGFDENGKLTNQEQAIETVRSLGENLRQVRRIVFEPAKNLHAAICAFREANRPVQTPTPDRKK